MEPPTVQKNKIECKMTFRNEEPHVNKCFPRIRGDVPIKHRIRIRIAGFSPHTRGCSGSKMAYAKLECVFPAYAGMFLRSMSQAVDALGFPRIRGDVPLLRLSQH